MDDNESIRSLVLNILKNFNFTLEFARDGKEAINLYKKSKNTNKPFDLVILDLTIPDGMGGKETIEKLIEIDPKVKAVVTSGYSNDPVLSDYKNYGFKSALIKPFDLTMIINSIKEAIEQ
jgi:CheY-like chemotaxis protein